MPRPQPSGLHAGSSRSQPVRNARRELAAVLDRWLPTTHPKILIVDDEEDSRRLLASLLQDRPCEFRASANGVEALQQMETFPPDLVLLDLIMPGMDGLAFLNRIRCMPRYQFLPVVVVTARELTRAESIHLQQMAEDVLMKGATLEADLKRILERFLEDGEPVDPA